MTKYNIKTRAVNSCPKFQACNAPICPLDENYKQRTHLRDEPVCFYLGESVKHALNCKIEWGMDIFCPLGIPELRSYINMSIPPLKLQLKKIAKTPSRIKRAGASMEVSHA